MLATRSGEWRASDPNDVAKWFNDRLEEHGEQLQRACRFLKAWRDYRWEKNGPSSVSIMIAVAQSFELVLGRDDLALEHAARTLAKALLADIREPGIDGGTDNFNRLSETERLEASALAQALANSLREAREHTHLHVSKMTTPQPGDTQHRYGFQRQAQRHQQIALEQWKAERETMDYIGEWHTHPEIEPTPSSIDTREWRKICRARSEPMVFLIAGTCNVLWVGVGQG